MYKNGGKMIATGSNSCVIHPNIKCLNNKNKKRDNTKISKIVFGKKAKENSEREKEINDTIKRIPGYKKWALIFDDLCKPPTFKDSISIDKEINKCLDEEDSDISHSSIKSEKKIAYDENSIMLIGDFGGITLGDYFKKNIKKNNIKNLEKSFLSLMKKMVNLFIGLIELNKYKIIHLDIKYNNIVSFKGNFKFIDFGLSNIISKKAHFLKRSYNEFNTNRIYSLYPLEYIYYNISDEEIDLELEKINVIGIDEYRHLMSMYIDIHEQFYGNVKDDVISILNDYKTMDYDSFFINEYSNLINGIDTYSLGMLIPILFYSNDILDNVNESKLLLDFFNLFKKMCEPYYKNRIHITEAYNILLELLKKYDRKSYRKSYRKSHRKSNRKSRKGKKHSKKKSKGKK